MTTFGLAGATVAVADGALGAAISFGMPRSAGEVEA